MTIGANEAIPMAAAANPRRAWFMVAGLTAFLLGWSAGALRLIADEAPQPRATVRVAVAVPPPRSAAAPEVDDPAQSPTKSALDARAAVLTPGLFIRHRGPAVPPPSIALSDRSGPPGVKGAFIRSILPVILHANAEVLAERRHLIELRERHDSGRSLTAADLIWLDDAARRYGLKRSPGGAAAISALLDRVDAVPVSLALAQSAQESGWGTSRPARLNNALFGEFGVTAEGLLRLRRFDHPLDSTRAYVFNLNSNPAFADFRAARSALRRAGQDLDGAALAAGLHRYSERGPAYISTVRTLIRDNALHELDDPATGRLPG
jgi:uncharacterized FlgJ-related protein